jgi:hypothetical protein
MEKHWKITMIVFCCIVYVVGKKPLYQHLWGKYTREQIEIGEEKFERFPDNQPWDKAKIGGYDIKYVLRRKYSVRGRVVFVDWYDGAIKTWYHSASNEGVKLYNDGREREAMWKFERARELVSSDDYEFIRVCDHNIDACKENEYN